MADELPAEEKAAEGTEARGAEEAPATEESREGADEAPAKEAETGEDGEPGGSDGKAVYQRKLYRENKQLREQLRAQEIEKARAEERARLLEEQRKQPPLEAARIFSLAEIEDAVTNGQISRIDAERYKENVYFPHRIKQVFADRERERVEREQAERPIARARREIGGYLEVAPWLGDDGDERTREVGLRYQALVQSYGLPQNEVTKSIAIQEALGPLEKLRKQKEVDNLTRRGTSTFTAAPSGGSHTEQQNGRVDLSKAPPTMKAYWEKVNLPEKSRIKELEIYNRLKGGGR